MKAAAKILLIDDDPGIRDTLQQVLTGEGCEVVMEKRGDDGLARAARESFNAVITDLKLPGLNGLDLVRQLHAAQPRLPIILITAFGTTQTAIEATKFGAYDYLLKPFEIPQLLELIRRAVDSNRLMSEPVALGESAAGRDALVGQSAAMREIYKEIGRVAAKPVNVLIRGETGTGKELIARALYQHSDRANAPFIAINCAAIPETLLESELFGHERGAFTGATAQRIGRFEQANHGTIFLDEIGDMTPGTQVKLLARASGKMPATARRPGNHSRGRARADGDASRFGIGHQPEIFPRRFVLPAQRRGHHPAAAPPAQGGHSRTGPFFSGQIRTGTRQRRIRPSGPKRWNCSSRKPGPATCANWKMPSARRCSSRRTTPSTPTMCARV